MVDLFDMMAGTSTGSILSTGLSIGKNESSEEPKFWGEDCVNIYIDYAPQIFKQNGVGSAFHLFFDILFISVFGAMFYFMGRSKYNNPKKW